MKKIILNNRRITVTEIADNVGISFGSCQAICTDVLGRKTAAARIVPKLQSYEQKKKTSHGHRLGDVDDVQGRYRFAQNDHNR